MSRRALASIALTFVAVATIGIVTRARERHAEPTPATVFKPASEILDLDLAFWEKRATEDPIAASDRSRLAMLYLRRARETGSEQDYARAERWARESVQIREAHNDATYGLLASALLARHAFIDARDAAVRMVDDEPGEPSRMALLGEIDLELGRYAEADSLFDRARRDANRPSIAARVARWHEVNGRLARAESLFVSTSRRAASGASDETGVTDEQRAWFEFRRGEMALKLGSHARADSAFHRALAIYPKDYRAMSALGRLALLDGRAQDAITWAERAIAVRLDPATLGTLSDAWAMAGDSAQARSYAQAMRVSALTQPGAIHRAWGLFLLDRKEDVPRVLARAQLELRTRRDVYGYDLVAWALHAAGRDRDAQPFMRQAMSRGTEDPMLDFHAGMIARAIGDTTAARADLERALARDPRFHHRHADEARAALASLGSSAPVVARTSAGGR